MSKVLSLLSDIVIVAYNTTHQKKLPIMHFASRFLLFILHLVTYQILGSEALS